MVSILIDDDILLRSWTAEDAPALFRAVDEDRTHLQPWLGWIERTTKPEHSAAYVQQTLSMAARGEAVHLGIFHQQHVIGGAGLHDRDERLAKASMGYWIAASFEGKGIMAKCLTRLLNFGFDSLNLEKVELQCAASNERSSILARRLGFVQEGQLRRAHWRNGTVEDLLLMGLLKQEWLRKT